MRSRYTAHVLTDNDYLRRTWHPDHRPVDTDSESNLVWQGLDILSKQGGEATDTAGTVEFVAHFSVKGKTGQLHEISHFERRGATWLYTTGRPGRTQQTRTTKTGRNEPCSCGSGLKYKRCCLIAG
jgi:SEC-C motif-containing protein